MTAVPDGSAGTASRRALATRGLATLVGLVLGLVLAELTVRAYAHIAGGRGRRIAARDPLGAIYEPFGNFGYRPTPGKVEHFPNDTRATYNSMAYRGPLVGVAKPKGVYRIVLLGGSTTVGYGVNDDQTIDWYMRRQLREQFPGACFEVVNLALGGYDSYQDYERMRVDGARLAPDLVVLHSGINDVRNAQFPDLSSPPDSRTLIWEGEMRRMREAAKVGPSLWTLAKHYSYLARLPGFVLDLSEQREALHVIQVVEPHDAALDYFETNVTRTIELGLNLGAAVLLSKPPSALSTRNRPSDPVEKSYWIKDAGTTEAYRDRLGARMADLAGRYRASGHRVGYVTHRLPDGQFLDDAHLTATGNATVARDLIQAAAPYFPVPDTSGGQLPCNEH
jgi:lysophospholipase L1-like esterase